MKPKAAAVFVLCGWCGCAAAPPSPPAREPAPAQAPAVEAAPAPAAHPPTAEASERLAALEQSLISEPVRLRFDVTASGLLECRMVGILEMEGTRVRLEAAGTFGDKPVELFFDANGTRMRGRGGSRAFELAQPAGLREAIAVGMVRMGLLHTLAVLTAGSPPDHADGDVRAWLELAVSPGAPTVAVMEPLHDSLPADPITFDVSVAGDPSVHATLWIEDGTIRARQQRTRFDAGEMIVRESFGD